MINKISTKDLYALTSFIDKNRDWCQGRAALDIVTRANKELSVSKEVTVWHVRRAAEAVGCPLHSRNSKYIADPVTGAKIERAPRLIAQAILTLADDMKRQGFEVSLGDDVVRNLCGIAGRHFR